MATKIRLCRDDVHRNNHPGIPPRIAELDFTTDPDAQSAQEAAVAALSRLEGDVGPGITAVSTLLIRTESIASSKIEHVEASMEDFARALAGIRSNESATSMVAASARRSAQSCAVEA